MADIDIVRQKYEMLRAAMDERMSRLWAASEAIASGLGRGEPGSQGNGISRPRSVPGYGNSSSWA